jgi:hypothetical protein
MPGTDTYTTQYAQLYACAPQTPRRDNYIVLRLVLEDIIILGNIRKDRIII